jgi:hypothetical protein
MGICKVVKNFIVYGGITVIGLYAMASCAPRAPNIPQSPLEKAADEGLRVTQEGLRWTHKGVEFLEDQVKKGREYLGGK